jgi:hypothetical protein
MLKVEASRSHHGLTTAVAKLPALGEYRRTSAAATMSAATYLEFGDGVLARISLGVFRPENPAPTFLHPRIATPIGEHPMVGIFDDHIKSRLIQEFAAANWSHITVVRLGYPSQEQSQCPATILVAVRPNTLDADGAAEMLRSTAQWLYAFPALHDVAIEVIEADVVPHSGNTSDDSNHPTLSVYDNASDDFKCPTIGIDGKLPNLGYCFEDAFRDVPAIGASLGIQHANQSGTLGGYLALRTMGRCEYMALTCHHVLSGMVIPLQSPRLTFTNPQRWPNWHISTR